MLLHTTLNNKNYIQSDKTFELPVEGFDFNVYIVPEEYIARPDLISLEAYGDTMFMDIICKINGISNPFELNEGMKLIIPNPDYILNFTFKAPQEELENEMNDSQPEAKPKQSKRKANEAVVGDSRYKIDPSTGIIIY